MFLNTGKSGLMKIKGTLLAMVFGIVTMVPLSAQLTVGGLLGLNVAGFNVKNGGGTGEDYTSRLGFAVGGVVTYPLMNGLAIQVEPMILQKGGKVTEFDETYINKLLYFEIPVFLRYNIALSSETVLPYVILGPDLGFRVSAKIKFSDGFIGDAKDQYKGIDFGVGLGGGVEVPHGNVIFFGEARYVFGLANINQEFGQSGEVKVMNRGLLVILGVKVPIPAK
jgi:hypothetical protein